MKYGMSSGGIDMSISFRPPYAHAIPSGTLMSATITLSVSSCRSIWPRAAPSAVRIDISRDRLDARASIRFATLKQAIRVRG